MATLTGGLLPLREIQIQPEVPENIDAIDQLNRDAFGGEDEPKLVTLLRERNDFLLSLVAKVDDTIVGHVCASRVRVAGNNHSIAGIGPLSVHQAHRKQGIGAMLMKEAVLQLKTDGCIAAVLLGDPNYYPRFGFVTASEFKLTNEYGATDAFMAIELQSGALRDISGLVQYVSAFAECSA